ncbi:MAG: hypothetical protein EKK48_10660 [Candidatus Melainabacteria bacterium]|nr:MAG: hypothetical protein EKK48_10660 [Candidatus Melainabacteria bacterium]
MPISNDTQKSVVQNSWFAGHHHPWLSSAIGLYLAGVFSFGTDLYLFWLNRPDDLDRGPHFIDDFTFTIMVEALGGCIVYVLIAVLQCLFDFLRCVFYKSET